MPSSRQNKGTAGEDLAVRLLRQKGYSVLTRNYRRQRGEIDIIARQNDVLVFIEVKLRTGTAKGLPREAVTLKKQKIICRTAMYYISEHDFWDMNCRFDVIEILLDHEVLVNHMENAFLMKGNYMF